MKISLSDLTLQTSFENIAKNASFSPCPNNIAKKLPFQTLYINVNGHDERKSVMESQLSKRVKTFERISAVTPDTLPPIIRKENVCIFPSELEYACMSSHIKA